MKRLPVSFAALALAWAGVAVPAVAAPCAPDTIAGTWSLVSIRAAEPGVEAFYARAPHEWISLIYMASNRPKGSYAEIQTALDQADAMDGVTYSVRWPRPGVLLMLRDGQPFQAFECNILETPDGDARAGDMLVTQVEGAPMLRRVERRVAP
jgi:hypothetical protein